MHVELLTGIAGVASRRVRRIVTRLGTVILILVVLLWAFLLLH